MGSRDAYRERLDRQEDGADQQVVCSVVSKRRCRNQRDLTGAEGKDAEAEDVERDLPFGPVSEGENELQSDCGEGIISGTPQRTKRALTSRSIDPLEGEVDPVRDLLCAKQEDARAVWQQVDDDREREPEVGDCQGSKRQLSAGRDEATHERTR